MKSVVNTLVLGLLGPFFVAGLVWFFFYREYVDLQYSLSEPLPTKFSVDSGTKAIQQLTIANQGNIPAKDVKIEVNADINRFDIEKNLPTDSFSINDQADVFQAVYEEIAVGSKVKVVFELGSGEILSSDLVVSHSKGVATEVLTGDSSAPTLLISLLWGLPAFYLIIIMLDLRSNIYSSYRSRIAFTEPHEFLSKDKPFLLSQNQWIDLREQYLKDYEYSMFLSYRDLESTGLYQYLDSSKPDYLSDSEWETFLNNLRKQFKDAIESLHSHYINSNMLEDLLKLSKPSHFSQREWDSFIESVSNSLVSFRLQLLVPFPTLSNIESHVYDKKPEGILSSSWDRFVECAKALFFVKAAEECLSDFQPLSRFDSLNKNLLSDESRDFLYSLAYKVQFNSDQRLDFRGVHQAEAFLDTEKPSWLTHEDLESLKSRAELLKSASRSIKEYEYLTKTLESLSEGRPLGERPDFVRSEVWESHRDFFQLIVKKVDELKTNQVNVCRELNDVEQLKCKLLKQLDVIDRVLSEPLYIDKIESFDNPFAPGNFENLKKVSNLLSKLE